MKTSAFEWGGCSFAAILTALQTQEVFQIISLVLTCLATVVTLAFTLWKWWKSAKEDGKITKEEIQQGIDIVTDGVKELENNLKEKK